MSIVFIRFPAPPGDAHPGDALQRAPLLERLLARADGCTEVADWRLEAYRVLADGSEAAPAVGPAALHAALRFGAGASASRSATAYVATPVHCVAAMTNVRLPPGGVLRLESAEAAELADDFNRVFAAGAQRLIAAPDGSLSCVFESGVMATGADPLSVVGHDIHGFLPSGPGGASVRRLMCEIEMWLFEHRVNQRRAAAGALSITGLWIWGGGPTVARLPSLRGWMLGADPFFAAWPALAAAGLAAAPGFAAAPRLIAASGLAGGSGVIVAPDLPGSAAWNEAQVAWLLPVLASLRSGRIARLELCAGQRRYSLSARWRWRLWRRSRPWWEFFE